MLLGLADHAACQLAIAFAVRLAEESCHSCCALSYSDIFMRDRHFLLQRSRVTYLRVMRSLVPRMSICIRQSDKTDKRKILTL
jgi:hypothetical protein